MTSYVLNQIASHRKHNLVIFTKVWTIYVCFMSSFQLFFDFSPSFARNPNSQKSLCRRGFPTAPVIQPPSRRSFPTAPSVQPPVAAWFQPHRDGMGAHNN